MATPLLDALCSAGYHVTVMTAPFVNPLLQKPGWNVDFRPLQNRREPWHVFRYAHELRKERYDVSVVLNRSFRAALIPFLARIAVRIGHANEGRGFLLTQSVPFSESRFEAFADLDLARALNLELNDVRPTLWLSGQERDCGRELADGATVAVQPGARFPEKQLPKPVLHSLMRRLADSGERVVLLGGKEERSDAEALASEFSNVVDLVGRTSLRETLGVLANLRLMAGADTGVIHLAAGVGCPTVTAFGPTPFEKWSHRYPPHRAIRAPGDRMADLDGTEFVEQCWEVLQGP